MTGFFISILEWIFGWVNNYGWSVIIFTLFVKLVLLPLDIKSRQSMRAMNLLNPQLETLKKRYANDQEKLNRKMQELYRSNHVSPLSGCLPILIQMPILFIMFAAMRRVAAQQQVKMVYNWLLSSGLASIEDGAVTLHWDVLSQVSSQISALEMDFGETQSWFWIKSVFQADNMNRFVIPSVSELTATLNQYGEYLTGEKLDVARKFIEAYTNGAGLGNAEKLNVLQTVLSGFGVSETDELFASVKAFVEGTSTATFEELCESIAETVKDQNALAFIKYVLQPTANLDAAALSALRDCLNGLQGVDASVKEHISCLLNDNATKTVFGSGIDKALAGTVKSYSGSILGFISIGFPTKFNKYVNGYFILPILACATQVLASKLQPATAGADMQPAGKDGSAKPAGSTGKIMKWLFPIMSLWICWSSTAAFAIYWVFVNVWSIVSSYGINFFLVWKDKQNKNNPKSGNDNSKNKKEALQP